MIVLLFYYKFATLILNLLEFGLNLVIVIKRLIILMSNLLVKQSKIAAVTVQMATEKSVYVRIEQLLFGFWDINAIAMTLWRINHPAPTLETS